MNPMISLIMDSISVEFQEIPEFGTIVIFVLVAAILALFAMRVKLPRILEVELYHNPSSVILSLKSMNFINFDQI